MSAPPESRLAVSLLQFRAALLTFGEAGRRGSLGEAQRGYVSLACVLCLLASLLAHSDMLCMLHSLGAGFA
jgi:uncharacterized protein YdbL (DUF1318 family)